MVAGHEDNAFEFVNSLAVCNSFKITNLRIPTSVGEPKFCLFNGDFFGSAEGGVEYFYFVIRS